MDQQFSLDAYQGVIAFGLGHPGQSEEDVLAYVNALMTSGWNTFQVCSENEYWTDDPNLPNKPRDPERLKWTLDLLARVPGVQVALVGNCTLKRQVPLSEQFAWAQTVANVAKEFRNVAIFTHNEFDNCAGRSDWGGNGRWCAGKQDVRQHIDMYRAAGFQVITADDSICVGPEVPKTYQFRLANISAWPASFHPCRSVRDEPWDPLRDGEETEASLLKKYGPIGVLGLNEANDLYFLQQMARYNGEFILSETVAWMDYSGRCNGLRTCDPNRIPALIDRCSRVPECHMTFHCENCLAGIVPTLIPQAR